MAQLYEKTEDGWQEILPDALDFYTGVQAAGITWNGTYHAVASNSRLYMFDRSGRRAPDSDLEIPTSVFHNGASSQRREIDGLTWDETNSLYWLLAKNAQDRQGGTSTRLVSLSPAGVVGTARTLGSGGNSHRWRSVIWQSTTGLLNVIRSDGQIQRWTTAQPPVASGSVINLPSGPDNLQGGALADGKFWMVDPTDGKIYVFTDAWARSATDDFDLVTDTAAGYSDPARDNTNPAGVSWDDRFLRVADNNYFRRKVFTYDLDGTHLGAA